jgi:hypothetical protein
MSINHLLDTTSFKPTLNLYEVNVDKDVKTPIIRYNNVGLIPFEIKDNTGQVNLYITNTGEVKMPFTPGGSGSTGPIGPTGPAGSQGSTGPTGPTGAGASSVYLNAYFSNWIDIYGSINPPFYPSTQPFDVIPMAQYERSHSGATWTLPLDPNNFYIPEAGVYQVTATLRFLDSGNPFDRGVGIRARRGATIILDEGVNNLFFAVSNQGRASALYSQAFPFQVGDAISLYCVSLGTLVGVVVQTGNLIIKKID